MTQALGIIETRGLIALVQAVDAMMKAADVRFAGWKKMDVDLCAIFVTGDAAAIETAIDAGSRAIESLGGVAVKTHVMPRPHHNLAALLKEYGIIGPSSRKDPSSRDSPPSGLDAESNPVFCSAEAESVKEEICTVGWKLWQRGYVDGNGGNISYRIGENAVLCTPTLLSKADLRPKDICLVDIEGNQLAGALPRTSEVLLHLEIFKNVPQARAVVHCHPPHATAYAITGFVPPPAVIPEFDVFIGSVAISPYETPGTQKFAETVLPFVRDHNTVLLGNHGIVCWADTPTHAEWYAENLETYCWTLLISRQLGAPYVKIPPEKEQDLLKIKKRLGLPDARFDKKKSAAAPERAGAIAFMPQTLREGMPPSARTLTDADVEAIAKAVANAATEAIERKRK